MIIHASLKTDITYFYMTWFYNRLKDGFFDIPSNKPGEIYRYNFKDNPIEKIFLHTKNPYRIIKNYDVLKSLNYNYEVITHLTMYDKFYETKISEKYKIFDYIRECAKVVGKNNNSMSYGPIFKTIINDAAWHINQFRFLCKILHKSITTIYYDFGINNMCKTSVYLSGTEFTKSEEKEIIKEFENIAKSFNLEIKKLPSVEEFKYDEIDIGEENTCQAFCKHCKYITNSKTANIKGGMHSPNSSLLIGHINSNDKIVNIILKEPIKEDEIIKKYNQYSLFDFT